MSPDGPRRTVRGVLGSVLLAGALLIGTAGQAGALPPEPYNPSDDELTQSQAEAAAQGEEVGRLSALVTTTEGEITRLQDDIELKAELALKAKIDLQLAEEDAAAAAATAERTKAAAVAAGEAITEAEDKAARFAAASLRQGSVLGSMTALVGADSPTDLLDRDELLRQVSASQLDVIASLEKARNHKANKDSDARVALAAAKQAQTAADEAKQAADLAEQTARDAFADGQDRLADLQGQLAAQQQAYQQALDNASGLQVQREQYVQWAAEKKAEEERLRKEAEERARKAEEARKAAAAAAAKAAAEQAERERQAQIAAAKEAAERAAAAKAAAEEAAALKAKQEKAAAAAAARKRAAEARQREAAAAAAAQAEKTRKEKAAAEAARKAAAAKAEREAAAAAAAARKAKEAADAAKKAQEQADAAMRGSGTGSGAYYQTCDAARAAGAAPLKKGQPGYRAALDPNGNGIACDAGTSYEPASSGGGSGSSGSSGGSVSVPSDGSKGSIVVNAALKWLGTQYAWGGGNSSGPTLGIRDGGTADRYGDYMKVGFDCSGLALYAWAQVGVALPHYSGYQYFSGQHIALSALQPGDLVFFAYNTSDPATIHHVAIYIGNNQMVEAPQSGSYVKISPLRTSGYIGATRPGT